MSKMGQEIIHSLKEAVAHAKGDTKIRVRVPAEIDVKAIRTGLKLTQEAFANRFGFSVHAVRHWEQGQRIPEEPVRAYLMVIRKNHKAVEAALAA